MSDDVWELVRFSTEDGEVSVLVSSTYSRNYNDVEVVWGDDLTGTAMFLIVPEPLLLEMRFTDDEERFIKSLEQLSDYLLSYEGGS